MTVRETIRQFTAALTHSGPSYQPEPLPRRGDRVEQWLKAQRDLCIGHASTYDVVDGLLDEYRLHADTGTPLDQHVRQAGTFEDCAGRFEEAKQQ